MTKRGGRSSYAGKYVVGYQVVFANEVFQTVDESNAYWEKTYALYEEGKIDPNGKNEYQPFPLTMINTVWE